MATQAKPKKPVDPDMDVAKALADFRWAHSYKKKFLQAAEDDMEFALGSQWDDDDVQTLKDAGVLPLTINEVAPMLQLLHGIQSQNRSDMKAYPEGNEDSVEADIVTRLIKNALDKQAQAKYKVTEMFNDGATCGESWLEPWLDYEDNLIFADLHLRKSDYYQFFPDPRAREYDLSDGKFFSKLTQDISEEDLLMLYPDAEVQIKNSKGSKIELGDSVGSSLDANGANRQVLDYGDNPGKGQFSWTRDGVRTWDLLEHYYKRYVDVYYVADPQGGILKKADSKDEADGYVGTVNSKLPHDTPMEQRPRTIKRKGIEFWLIAILGGEKDPIAHEPTDPSWKGWPAIPYFARRSTAKLKAEKRDLLVQGITRQLKDLNREKNKRRTQELRHLNQSANSGWLSEENAWVDRDKVDDEGSAPGVTLEFKQGMQPPTRIMPTPLSAGHSQLAAENTEDLKRASGINTDLLAAEGGTDSGRAIALRQKQGLVMVQGLFDNLSRTMDIFVRYILSQLPELFTVERAMRVCGDAFMKDNFSVPVMGPVIDPKTGQPIVNPQTGQPAQQPVIDPQTGQPATQVDMGAAKQLFNQVLTDKELSKYDVAIGEVVSQETEQYANYVMLQEMMSQGIPIPPEILIDQSTLDDSEKAKINQAIMAEQAAAAAAGKQPGAGPKK